ncbi:anaerobic ribonucleoside-triphosphate reductase activating protein [Thiolapillus sp.]
MPDSSLRIGGFVPFTSIDYPGKLAAVIFCQGCPWRCDYCHNPHLLPAGSGDLLDWQVVLGELEKRRGFLDAVVFSGGEPTAQQALSRAMKEVSDLGFKIGLHTAGCYPERLDKLLPLLDWVGLDIKDLPKDYPALTRVANSGQQAWKSLKLLLSANIPLQVRTTVHPGIEEDQVATLCKDLAALGVKNHVLQTCRPVIGNQALQ